jgi:hypothetical protein
MMSGPLQSALYNGFLQAPAGPIAQVVRAAGS